MKSAMVFGLVALLAVGASAYCPNLCSGHGTCGDEDVCSCYTQMGTDGGGAADSSKRAAWTGPDCSLRLCPLSPSWSGSNPNGNNQDLSVGSVVGHAITTAQFDTSVGQTGAASGALLAAYLSPSYTIPQGTEISATIDGDHKTFTVYSYTLENAGSTAYAVIVTYQSAVGLTTDWTLHLPERVFSGSNSGSDPNMAYGVHARSECAGQGLCDRATGTCGCFAGYGGEACTRTVCENDCSGHGTCLSLRRLGQDAADLKLAMDTTAIKVYNGWDAHKQYGCKCDYGFRGADCSEVECPSETDPMWGCGGGTCNLNTATMALEKILDSNKPVIEYDDHAGLYKTTYEGCETTTTKCADNEQRDCSGRGLCDYTSGLCNCFSGFYGEACQVQTILV